MPDLDRLFPELERLTLPGVNAQAMEDLLTELGGRMIGGDNNELIHERNCLPAAGQTYFGQFINHDLTYLQAGVPEQPPALDEHPVFWCPRLNLSALYGEGPGSATSGHLYDTTVPGAEQFHVGPTVGNHPRDLPRDPVNGRARLAHPRNDENLLLAQLTCALLKFHNAVLKRVVRLDLKAPGVDPNAVPFEHARRLVVHHYQWVICRDFLPRVLHPKVWQTVPELERRFFKPPFPPTPPPPGGPVTAASELPLFQSSNFALPREFWVAAFRFGHSLVRNHYTLNANQEADLSDLFAQTGYGGGLAPDNKLADRWMVDWQRFVDSWGPPRIDFMVPPATHFHLDPLMSPNGQPNPPTPPTAVRNKALQFDTAVARGLHQLPLPEPRLPVLTLRRGERMGLPSGQDVAAALGLTRLDGDELVAGARGVTEAFREHTPLWYYLLRESELESLALGDPVVSVKGCRLGELGSRIVLDTIRAVLRADKQSFWWAPGDWRPTLPADPASNLPNQLGFFTLATLLEFSGVWDFPG